jgi:F420-dependent oxidoreductase-like protein
MPPPVRFGVTLPQIKRTWDEAKRAALAFDRLGFDSVWACDHVYGVPMPSLPILEAWTELAAVAAVTERVELGTLVTPPYFRNPAMLAKQVATLDQVSGGRTIVGLGVGWFEQEFAGYGCPFPPVAERLTDLEDTCEILRRMWTEPEATYEGRRFAVRAAACEPKPVRRPPILIGGGGEKVLLRIAAKHADVWNNMAVAQGDLERKIGVFRRHLDAVGRDPAEVAISQQCTIVLAATEAEAKQALEKAGRIYGGHMGAAIEQHGIWGTPPQVIDRIERHVRLGCTHFVIEFFGRDTTVPATLFAEEVIPAFAGGTGASGV